ncbi:outer membrane protein assembly factor BamE [Aliiruegeria sabulilitoris]|uniref:outer membrane protein assembly factor BamE n=1 Tax=Aliiruegeria sabulilitoris TaxID=1510458 RepID=UPI001E55F65C|nr:outer membrane protein assembly factor BamE [Aliiruegeria sabulilitoris]
MTRALCMGIGLLAISACEPIYDYHGYAPSDDQLAEIIVGKDTRETVTQLIGSPSSTGVLKDSGFYYMSMRKKSYLYQAPEVIEREVVAISFNDKGVVTNVERFGLQDGNVVALSRRVTASNIEGLTFLQQLFGNIGSLDIGSDI